MLPLFQELFLLEKSGWQQIFKIISPNFGTKPTHYKGNVPIFRERSHDI